MTFRLFDSHTHAHFLAFDKDRDGVVKRALERKVGMINVGTKLATSQKAVALSEKCPDISWAAVGFHPIHIEPNYHDENEEQEMAKEEFDYEKFKELTTNPKVVAVGECGLDFYRIRNQDLGIRTKQKEVFIKQIELAHELGKPLVIHCRDAFEDLVEILNSESLILNSPPGVIHFFSGSWSDAQKLLELGFYLGFAGPITFTHDYDEVIAKTPLERILIETDAPYAAPSPYRGKRNEPIYVEEIVKKIAEIKGIAFEEVAAKTTENAKRLFRI